MLILPYQLVWLLEFTITCWAQDLDSSDAGGGLLAWAYDLWMLVAPGGKLHPSAFLENRGHLVVESVLVAVIVYLLWQPRTKPAENGASLLDMVCTNQNVNSLW